MSENNLLKPETSKLHKRVVVVVNKWWECEPFLYALLNDNARPVELKWPILYHHPWQQHQISYAPRLIFILSNIRIEIWCISDILAVYPNKPEYQSSSERKMEQLPSIYTYSNRKTDLIIAAGTAASYPPNISINGCVICGSKVFMHNGHPNGTNIHSNWQKGPFDKIIKSSLKKDFFDRITNIETDPSTIGNRFLIPPLNPAPKGGKLITDYNYVALGTINITDYSEYDEKDKETLQSYHSNYPPEYGKSIETTHSLIRAAAGDSAPFLFVSGIVDRVGHFKEDVAPRSYAQNTVGAHNAGIVVAWMLPKISSIF